MIRAELTRKLESAVGALIESGVLPPAIYPIEITEPRNAQHGDFATNFALTASKSANLPPPKIAEQLSELLKSDTCFDEVTIAGPGFINLKLTEAYLAEKCNEIVDKGESFALTDSDHGLKINIEFVSVNPNGSIHVGHGRGAAYGDTLARVLEAAGNRVSREFYVNDGVNSEQMRLFALSVQAKYLELIGKPYVFPESGYRGEDVDIVAQKLRDIHGDSKAGAGIDFFQPASQDLMIESQKSDLARFGVVFDTWFSEQSLHDAGKVEDALKILEDKGVADREPYCDEIQLDPNTKERKVVRVPTEPGALWLRSTRFGDDKDRVIIRQDGRPTYIASDIAYHKDKFERGFDHLIDVWGADHHGYIGRTAAAIEAMGFDRSRFEALIIQIVRFLKGGEVQRMQKRTGESIPLRDLMDDVGVDVARWFYLMRSHETHMDFDLDLAKEHSEQNPVFYVQYAHARICSLLAKAKEQGFEPERLSETKFEQPERELIKTICDLRFEIHRAAESRQVHRLTTYAVELARQYHDFYEKCRVISPEEPIRTRARLTICEATRTALRATFSLLGVSAPERM
ncbi:MAG: arginine--tRNA ligase [Fimbriimonadales bacterium]|nr:arginine--tRNA ligase [Fimbriimonadales bacterium]